MNEERDRQIVAEARDGATYGELARDYGLSRQRVHQIARKAGVRRLHMPLPGFDLVAFLERQRDWSRKTFGPGRRTAGISEHIRKELAEIAADPFAVEEWCDVVILALDGAWRAGHTPEQVVAALQAKQERNIGRQWPPPGPEDEPTEHIREAGS